MTENEKFGQQFKKLRILKRAKQSDLIKILSVATLRNFENGKSMLPFDKLDAALKHLGFTLSDFMYLVKDQSVNQLFGKHFHTIRYQRGYRSDFFLSIGIIPERVKLFEDGDILLPYDTIDAMLGLMHISEQDYSYVMNGNMDDYFIHYTDLLDYAQVTRNIDISKKIEKEAHESVINEEIRFSQLKMEIDTEKDDYSNEVLEKILRAQLTRPYSDFRVLELTAKSCYAELSEDEVTEVGDFLFGIELWLEFSLSILALNAWQLPYPLMKAILTDILKKKDRYNNKIVYRRRIVQAASFCAMTLATKGETEHAEVLIDLVSPFVHLIDSYVLSVYRFSRAFTDFKMGKKSGKVEMLKVIDFLDFFGDFDSRDFVQAYYNKNALLG